MAGWLDNPYKRVPIKVKEEEWQDEVLCTYCMINKKHWDRKACDECQRDMDSE